MHATFLGNHAFMAAGSMTTPGQIYLSLTTVAPSRPRSRPSPTVAAASRTPIRPHSRHLHAHRSPRPHFLQPRRGRRAGVVSLPREHRRDLLDRRAGADRHLAVEVLAQEALVVGGLEEFLLVKLAPEHGVLTEINGLVAQFHGLDALAHVGAIQASREKERVAAGDLAVPPVGQVV